MIRSIITLAALTLTVVQAEATTLWTCKYIGYGFQNEKLTFVGHGTSKGLAQIRAKNQCQKQTTAVFKPCSEGPCTRRTL